MSTGSEKSNKIDFINEMWEISQCCYENDNSRIHSFVEDVSRFEHGDNHENAALMGVYRGENVVIAFRGSLTPASAGSVSSFIADWKQNVSCIYEELAEGGCVHQGFFNIAKSFIGETVSFLKKHERMKVILTGHSQGGAAALLMAYLLKESGCLKQIQSVVTYGAPRVGDETFGNASLWGSIDVQRYENIYDIVPHLPLSKEELLYLHRVLTLDDRVGMLDTVLGLKSELCLFFQYLLSLAGEQIAYGAIGKPITVIQAPQRETLQACHVTVDEKPKQLLNVSSKESLHSMYAIMKFAMSSPAALPKLFSAHQCYPLGPEV